MSLVRRLARPLLAAPFVAAGADAVLDPASTAETTRALAAKLDSVAGTSTDAEHLARATGTVQVGAGAMLALGRLPRLTALLLAVSLIPSIAEAITFWKEEDPATRREKRARLLRDAGLLGGALLGAADTAGRPGLGWRGRHAVRAAKKAARRAARDARRSARQARAERFPS
jgi:putative oxidoreductase